MQRPVLLVFGLLVFTACGDDIEGMNTPTDAGMQEMDSGTLEKPDSGMESTDAGDPNTCVDLIVFGDEDGDNYGVSTDQLNVCLLPGEEQPGYARQAGDCKATDPWANPAATEICNDYYDDDCDGSDEPCPTTNQAELDVPQWDCISNPIPNNVYAYALFADGGSYFQPNGCFIFFEGLPNEFYVQRVNMTPVSTAVTCTQIAGCVCPSSPSYDRRLYAVTKSETVEPCTELSIRDHGGETQPVSTDCRKFLYQMHWPQMPPPPYSYVAGSLEAIERRITLFPTAEIVCANNPPNTFLPFASLLSVPIQKNSGFVKK